MANFNFFIRNVIRNRTNADYIHISDGGIGKQTCFIAYGDNAPAKKAAEMAQVANFEKHGGEASKAFFAALKTFMAMGYNTDFTYSVDDDNNVHLVAR